MIIETFGELSADISFKRNGINFNIQNYNYFQLCQKTNKSL